MCWSLFRVLDDAIKDATAAANSGRDGRIRGSAAEKESDG